ncbi:hypothetical protein CCUS01_03754 [Colletotrichum cuscutae]|uniref:Uncharacterized protein n=1 Tax=Colletotrichum cuscutae TaxID=1209917 RepID=A0AAI9Y5X3_9PEZI|nr:hypothetical protein CCUS01_03754 [Colletotrichum cuscutae]
MMREGRHHDGGKDPEPTTQPTVEILCEFFWKGNLPISDLNALCYGESAAEQLSELTDAKYHLQPTKTHLSPGYGYGYTEGANHHIFRILAGTSPLKRCFQLPTTDRNELRSKQAPLDGKIIGLGGIGTRVSTVPPPLSCNNSLSGVAADIRDIKFRYRKAPLAISPSNSKGSPARGSYKGSSPRSLHPLAYDAQQRMNDLQCNRPSYREQHLISGGAAFQMRRALEERSVALDGAKPHGSYSTSPTSLLFQVFRYYLTNHEHTVAGASKTPAEPSNRELTVEERPSRMKADELLASADHFRVSRIGQSTCSLDGINGPSVTSPPFDRLVCPPLGSNGFERRLALSSPSICELPDLACFHPFDFNPMVTRSRRLHVTELGDRMAPV